MKKNIFQNPLFVLIILMVVVIIGIGLFFLIKTKSSLISENQKPSEDSISEQQSNERYIETVTWIPNTAFYIENQGRLIGFLDQWGGYKDKNRIRISILTPDEVEVSGTQGVAFTYGVEFDNYNILLDEDVFNSDLAFEKFLNIFYDTKIDPDLDQITKEEFVESAKTELGEENYFVIKPKE